MLLSALGGCLPIPNTRIEGSGIKSRIVDSASNSPVTNATIRDPMYGMVTKTNWNGDFFLKPHVQWHFGYLWPLYPIWPLTFDLVVPFRRFRVEAAGYVTKEFDIEWDPKRADSQLADPEGQVLLVSPLTLQRVSPATNNSVK